MPPSPWRVAALAACVALPTSAARAQSRPFAAEWRWARFSTLTGLPSDNINAIAEAADGTPWVATGGGLAWYDGYRWHPAGPAARSDPEGRAPAVMADPAGGVIAVLDGRLLRGDTSRLTDITPASGAGRAYVLDAVPDGEGLMLLVLGDDSLVRVGPLRAGVFRPVPSPARLSLREPALWLGTPGPAVLSTPAGMWAWSNGQWRSWLGNGTSVSNTSLADAGGGVMLYASLPPAAGLWEATDGRTFRRIASEGSQQAVALARRGDGEALAAYQAGEVRYRARDRWVSLDVPPEGLRDVTTLQFRPNGDLWSGTRHGLYLYRRSSNRWWWSTPRPFPDQRNRVNAIARTRDGTIWLGTGNGVVMVRRDGSERTVESTAGVRLGSVTAVTVDSLDRVWIGSGADFVGVVRFDGRTWRHFGAAAGLPTFVHRIERDRHGGLWFLGLGGPAGAGTRGIYTATGERFARWDRDGRLAERRVYGFDEGPDGALWFGVNSGLLRWRDGRWTEWRRPVWMAGPRVFSVTTDDMGRAWFSSVVGGVGMVDGNDSLTRFTTADGLVDDRVWEVRRGPDGRIWFATAAGLGSYRDGQWARFGHDEGLEAPHLWPVVPEADRVLVGTLGRGFAVLSLDEEDNPPAVWLDRPEVFGRSAQVRWQPLSFWGVARQERVLTRYRVDDRPWSSWSTRREADTELGGGRHTVEVQAISLFGRTGATAQAMFTVPRPLPLRPGFFVPVLLLLGAVGVVGARASAQRRQDLRQVAALEEQLRQSQKMEAIGQLAGGVAHDFNNILTAVMGHAELLAASLPPGEEAARGDVREILVTAERGAAMIRKLLMFGRRGRLEVTPVALDTVAGDLTAMLSRLLPERIRLVVSHRGSVTALADRAALEQVLVNLATNARDAMPDGGELRIAASEHRLDPVEAARCGLAAGGRYACLEVTDSGAGMDAETLSHVFEPFFTTKQPDKGTGLGLAMAYSLVRQQQGGIEIRSAPGAGTRVRLFFPLARPGAAVPAPRAPAEVAPAASAGTLLVVEDDPTVRAATSRVLERHGYTVVSACDGEEAMDILRRDAASVDLVVTDVMMPGMSGFALYAAASAEGVKAPFIFTSGYSEHPDAGAPPADAIFLPKPWTAAALMAQVRQVLEADGADTSSR